MTATPLAGIVAGMNDADYHNRPELSSTEARIILESPARYRWAKDHPPLVAPSLKFDLGSAIHSKVLGTGAEVVIIPADILGSNGAVNTKAAHEFVAEARTKGQIPLKIEQFEPIDMQAESILAHRSARALFDQPGDAEVSVFAQVDGIDVRARFDYLPEQRDDRRIAPVDLKSTRDASPRGFARAIATYGYDVQECWYLDAYTAITGPMPFDLEPGFVFVAVEKDPPYLVGVYQLPTIWKEMGKTKARVARQTYAECVKTGIWPGYSQDIEIVDPPTWLTYQHEEDYPNV